MSPGELYTKDERKVNGIYYTPLYLSDYLTKKSITILVTKERLVVSLIQPAEIAFYYEAWGMNF
jgi:hypothetical protein